MTRLCHLLAWFPTLLLGPEDAGAGSGTPGGGAPAPSPFDDLELPPDPDPAALAHSSEDEEDERLLAGEDETDIAPAGETADQRVNRMAKALSKHKRRLAKALPVVKRVRGLNLDELAHKARQYDELDALFKANPRLRAVMEGRDTGTDERPGSTRTDSRAAAVEFDEKGLPFDPNLNPVQRWMADIGKMVAELKAENTRLKGEVTTDRQTREQQTAQQAERAEKQAWKSAIDKVLPHVPKRLHGLLNDAMITAYRDRGQHKLTPQQVLGHYVIKQLGLSPVQSKAALAAAAAKARTVQQNKGGWPTSQKGGGAPAPAQRQTMRMADVRKRLQRGASAGG